jgi:hypothetical protein
VGKHRKVAGIDSKLAKFRGVSPKQGASTGPSLTELRALGERHTGYVFLTFATSEDAKKALVLAKMNFQPFFYDKLEEGPFVDLLRDDFHMDYDEDFQIKQIGRYMLTEQRLDAEVDNLRNEVLQQEK